jgi:hypothetical protein
MSLIPMAYHYSLSSDQHEAVLLETELNTLGFHSIPQLYLRSSPYHLYRTSFFWFNYLLTVAINFAANIGFGYALLHSSDGVGLWAKATSEKPYNSMIWADFLATVIIISFLNNAFAIPGIRDAIRKGKTIPIDDKILRENVPWKYLPILTIAGTVLRGLLLAAFMGITYYCMTLLIFAGTCNDGYWLGGRGSLCYMNISEYIYFKALWAAGVAACVYPLIFIAAHNRKYLPTEAYEAFLTHAKLKYEEDSDTSNYNKLPTV